LVRWCATAGVSADIEAITRKEAGRFIADAVAAKAARATINRKLSTLRAYWGWLVARGHVVADDPWKDQRLSKGRLEPADEEKARPFTDAELTRLLTGGADAVLADFIRVAALTGARVESIAQLQARDCRDGVFNIRRDKSKAGTRRFPIHSGLLALVARRCEGQPGNAWLFPECAPTQTGSRSAAIVKRFRTYRIGLGIHDPVEGRRGSLVTFHSLRKWFVTAAIQAGQPEHIVQQVIGHKRQGITLGVYHGGDTLERLRECVEAVRLPGASEVSPGAEQLSSIV
jgi:integrase